MLNVMLKMVNVLKCCEMILSICIQMMMNVLNQLNDFK